MNEIPISAAKEVAEKYGYDQIVIIGRVIDKDDGFNGWEHVTTYGVDKANCDAAAKIGNHLKYNVMRWPRKTLGGYQPFGKGGNPIPPGAE